MSPAHADSRADDLWAGQRAERLQRVAPLPVRMRPRTLDEVAGQRHLLGDPADPASRPLLRRMIETGALTSILLHGPPGTGKTTLARVIARTTNRHFVAENAAGVGVKRVREIVDDAVRRLTTADQQTILFLDEIHRFSKSQQDVLLEDVERGRITLVGATTENPLFAVNSALVSRSTLFRLEPLEPEEIGRVVRRALEDAERGYGGLGLAVDDDALAHWARTADGDARRALAALELAALSLLDCERGGERAAAERRPAGAPPLRVGLAMAQDSIQHKALRYDRHGDQHYDHASAIIKSIRGSDPDAALYWLAIMLEAGEDPRFIARRLAILASEDIGNADPDAITVANSAWSLVERIGMPEARITLAQCATYLALAPKSNASYLGVEAALRDVRTGETQPVPLHIRDKTKARSEGSPEEGRGYHYSHDAPDHTSMGPVAQQSYLTAGRRYYDPTGVGFERTLAERLAEARAVRARRSGPDRAES